MLYFVASCFKKLDESLPNLNDGLLSQTFELEEIGNNQDWILIAYATETN